MEKQNVNNFSEEIDLIQLVKVLVKRKWVLIGGTLAITLAALVICFLLPRSYQSNGFFRLSSGVDVDLEELKKIQDKIREDFQEKLLDNLTLQNTMLLNETLEDTGLMMKTVSIPDYKKYLSQFTNPSQLMHFMDEKKKNGDKSIKALKSIFRASEDIEQLIEPVYAFSKKDLKELTQNPKDTKNFVLGVQLTAEGDSPENAQAFTKLIGEFIKDCILYGKLDDYISTQWNKSQTEFKKFENFIIKDEFELELLKLKRAHIEQLLKTYPGAKEMVSRELYSLENNGHRYLSPVAQLVGIESHIADIKENLAQNLRNKKSLELKLDFFSKAKDMVTTEKFGRPLLDQLEKLKNSILSEKELPGDVVQQVKNELGIDLDKFMNLNEEMQFISGPTLSHTPVKPKTSLITAISFVLGFVLCVFLVFVLDWWGANKQKIVNKTDEKNENKYPTEYTE
ncbi:MAG: Wzz protein [Acidobacteriota bacterium]|nr:Wzz protein [Acidobacteriota bacterium]